MEKQNGKVETLQVGSKNKRARKKKNNHQDETADIVSTVPVVDLTGSDMLEITQYDEDIESHKDKIVCGLRKTLPPYLLKYWHNRYNLFSRYNEGCLIDEEGWFSVTPELVARQIATRMACDVIIDAFCGVGGNSIQFAHTCKKVIAIDNNPTRLAFAKHNAKVYGVGHKIDFILGDFFETIPSLKADAIFLSPPWGGPAYNTVPTFDIHTMMPFSGVRLFKLCASITPNIGYFLPRNTDYNQLACLATPIGNCEVEEAYSSHKFIAITAYYGKIVS
ncbi:putative diacylglycerol O-acyltransferase tgs1, variant 2 [Entomophthora muscae]|nr:putative diacylglycerol O-acyltransferase tgs1, variant 2 [Entomophthora muscae]